MDQFVASSSKTRPRDPNLTFSNNQPPTASPFSPFNVKGSGGLRRSTGRINLNLNQDTQNENEKFPQEKVSSGGDIQQDSIGFANITPDSTYNLLKGNSQQHKATRSRRYTNPLKRSHPSSSAKSANKVGVTGKHIDSDENSISRSGQKRLHLNDSKTDIMTPDASFKGARPVQTAFASTGLQSKQSVTNSPRLQVPETPCKRTVGTDSTFSNLSSNTSHNDDTGNYSLGDRSWNRMFTTTSTFNDSAASNGKFRENLSLSGLDTSNSRLSRLSPMFPTSFTDMEDDDTMADSPISHSYQRDYRRTHTHTPVDRLQRFSLSNIEVDTDLMGGAESENSKNYLKDLPPPQLDAGDMEPETPTKLNDIHTSTPLKHTYPIASRLTSDAATMTPGTVHRPLPSVIRSIDPADSLSVVSTSSLGPLPPPIDLDESFAVPQTPCLHASKHKARQIPHSDTMPALSLFPDLGPTSSIPSVPLVRPDSPTPNEYLPATVKGEVRTPSRKQQRLAAASSTPTHSSPCTPGKGIANTTHQHDQFDDLLAQKFDRIQNAGVGEFSTVFIVSKGKSKFAVKRTKRPMISNKQRQRRLEEVRILKQLSVIQNTYKTPTGLILEQSNDDDDSSDVTHIVQLMDEWVADGFGYIMTEYCENGDLNKFLAAQGRVSRLEEWRVWKILAEVLQGLAIVHDADVLHLDLKPANILVTFEGHLKIGDFGMATKFPVPAGFEREGDREYIAPEILERHEYGKPADIFSIGLMMVEIAANIVLPDNGEHWQKLRSGDLSDAGRLSSGDLASSRYSLGSMTATDNGRPPSWAPSFLIDDSRALDRIVQAMLDPDPKKRPTVKELLFQPELMFTMTRGQAGAIVYEGEFGPEPEDQSELAVWQHA